MKKKLTLNTKALLAFILSIAALRVGFSFGATPMSNFTPIGAMALFGGAYFTKKWQAFLLPLATLWLSDVVMNRFIFFHEWRFFYEGAGYVYGAFAMMVLAGSLLKRVNVTNVFVSMLVITFIHWIVSDIGVWLSSYSLYPKTWGGYVACLIAAIPYELNFLAGTIVYGALMFGTAEWMIARKIFTRPALAAQLNDMPVLTSFLPAATQMIYDMELDSMLRGVTFECPPIAAAQPKVVRCVLEGKNYSSQEIDRIFSASKQEGRSLYYVDEPLLAAIAPDVIFTQDVCEVCQIDTECTARAVANLAKQPRLVALTPQSLEDVFHTAVVIAEAAGKEENAYKYLAGLTKRMDHITDQLRKFRASLKRVMLMEWMEPIYNCGHWIPHQIAYAGGVDMLSNPSGDSIVTSWEKIRRCDPEILVIAPCGFSVQRSLEELHLLTVRPGWPDLQAVKNNRVYVADFDLFTQPSAHTLVQGIELLAGLFHPDIISTPENLRTRYAPFGSAHISIHS